MYCAPSVYTLLFLKSIPLLSYSCFSPKCTFHVELPATDNQLIQYVLRYSQPDKHCWYYMAQSVTKDTAWKYVSALRCGAFNCHDLCCV